jgi:hypothetical protein
VNYGCVAVSGRYAEKPRDEDHPLAAARLLRVSFAEVASFNSCSGNTLGMLHYSIRIQAKKKPSYLEG